MTFSRETYRKGHLTAKPAIPAPASIPFTGEKMLELGNEKENLIYVPKNYQPDKPASLAVMLHGAGGNARHGMALLQEVADAYNMILIAPASREYSWDIIADNAFGRDVLLIDEALEFAFTYFAIDAAQVAIGGFSDGASYALSIGLGNGDLFTHIIAFSPGFFHIVEDRGAPQVFISHGTEDRVLPINACSRRIVPRLQRQGIPVLYKEFNGEHIIPEPIRKAAVTWFVNG